MTGGGGFFGLVMKNLTDAENCYVREDGMGACSSLEGAAILLEAKTDKTPYTSFNPRFSTSANRKLLDHYLKNKPKVMRSFREWMNKHMKEDGVTVE